jgi:hypothetical protein
MFKKIVAGTLLAGLIGILVLGAINRTMDRTAKVAEAQGRGSGQGRAEGESNGRDGYGQGGAGNGANERQYPNYQAAPEEWATYEGAVVQAPENGEELVIATGDGQEVTIGTGPSYMAAQGFTLQAGEMVQVQGYWEDNELKAAQVTRLADGQTIALRDEMGRPAWAGGGRNAQAGREGQGAPGDPASAGQAEVGEWLQFQGIVTRTNPDALVVETAAGEELIVEGRPWRFAQEQGFLAQVGDQVTLTGFYEGSDLEVGRIENVSNGQTVLIRDENGRPLWAGFGRRDI